MYLKYYSLREPAFGVTPDPAFLYLSPSHKEALASLLYGIEKRKGFITVTGEVGCGKTTVLKALLNRINAERVKAVYLFNPEVSFTDLLRAIFEELGLGAQDCDLAMAVRHLHHYLIENYRQGNHVVLIVDEAQRMPVDTLERLRILSNLETTKDKLLQIVLCGQPELEKVLSDPVLRQLRQRVAVRSTIKLLIREESLGYIKHRLERVSYGKMPVFSPGASRRIVRYAKGNPRTINIVCDNALIAGYADQKRPVTVKIVKEVIAGLQSKRKTALFKWAFACATGLVILVGASIVLKTVGQRPSQEVVDEPASAHASLRVGQSQFSYDKQSPAEAFAVEEGAQEKSLHEIIREPAAFSVSDVLDIPEAAKSRPTTETRPLADEFTEAVALSTQKGHSDARTEEEPSAQAANADSDEDGSPHEQSMGLRERWTVRPGDRLNRLLTRIYGHWDKELVERTLQYNPHIRDANRIFVGDTIMFPELDRSNENKDGRLPAVNP